jgi:translation initiation factor 3 subunit H
MDVDGVIQVTQSFQYLSKSRRHEEEDENAELDENYQMEMLKCLRQVNADANMVGWYHAAPLSHFIQHSWVSIQADFQANIPQSIVLEYGTALLYWGTFCVDQMS